MSFIGVDHVCATVSDTEMLARNFAAAGMGIAFHERDVEVADLKAPVMGGASSIHHMLLVRPQSGMLFEAIDHCTGASDRTGPYQVLFRGGGETGSNETTALTTAASAAFETPASSGVIPGSDIPCVLAVSADDAPGVAGVILSRADVDAAVSFWTDGVGFRETARDADGKWVKLTFTSPMPSWSHSMLLVQDGDNQENQLDDQGWTCLSMLTTDMDAACNKVIGAGGTVVTDVYEVPADGKMLRLCFARGRTGELIELLDMRSTVSK